MKSNEEKMDKKIAILGCGNIGSAVAFGFTDSEHLKPENLTLTRRKLTGLELFKDIGCKITSNNSDAVKFSDIILCAVTPLQMNGLLSEIKDCLDPEKHIFISAVSGVSIQDIKNEIGDAVKVVRIMPNTAAAICESMTCIAFDKTSEQSKDFVIELMEMLGDVLTLDEELMGAATALGACGVAFFLRSIRAASQGGIEIGFHAQEAIEIAAQTARGAATLVLAAADHPESAIDLVTTPKGATISGLNEMEHQGFSSAFIKGITTSHGKISTLTKK